MWERHGSGKMRPWFTDTTRWHIVLLDGSELGNLVFLESDWTKQEALVVPSGTDYRILDRVAVRAISSGYLLRPSAHKHKAYYDALAAGTFHLAGDDRVAVCSAEDSEVCTNPSARHYLLDGVGRCLPYMILVKEHAVEYEPVEAFLAER